MKKTLLFSITLLGLSVQANAQLVINEIMQSNIDCIMDDLNEFPDSCSMDSSFIYCASKWTCNYIL